MEMLFPCELTKSSISQCILKAIKSRSIIPPILFGSGVELDHVFGSRSLIDELYKLEFCVFYREIAKFKQEVVANQNMDHVIKDMSSPETFTQWAADNVSHSVRTLDGTGTFAIKQYNKNVSFCSNNNKPIFSYEIIQRNDSRQRNPSFVV